MHFRAGLILTAMNLMLGSTCYAGVGNFNELITSGIHEESELNRKIITQIPDSEIATAFNSSWEKTKEAESTKASDIAVNLVMRED